MKRDNVAVDCEKVNPMIKENGWSNASFSRLVGKYPSWYSEVRRGNNLPSPEEAAKMCDLLGVEPGEILTEPADIKRVSGLLEKGAEKERPANSETLDRATQNELFRQMVNDTNDMGTLLEMLDTINKKMQELK